MELGTNVKHKFTQKKGIVMTRVQALHQPERFGVHYSDEEGRFHFAEELEAVGATEDEGGDTDEVAAAPANKSAPKGKKKKPPVEPNDSSDDTFDLDGEETGGDDNAQDETETEAPEETTDDTESETPATSKKAPKGNTTTKPPVKLKDLPSVSQNKFSKETVVKELNALAKKKDKKDAYAVLKKFKVKSVNDLEPTQYGDVLKEIKKAGA